MGHRRTSRKRGGSSSRTYSSIIYARVRLLLWEGQLCILKKFKLMIRRASRGHLSAPLLTAEPASKRPNLLVHSCEHPEPTTRTRLRTHPALHDSWDFAPAPLFLVSQSERRREDKMPWLPRPFSSTFWLQPCAFCSFLVSS